MHTLPKLPRPGPNRTGKLKTKRITLMATQEKKTENCNNNYHQIVRTRKKKLSRIIILIMT